MIGCRPLTQTEVWAVHEALDGPDATRNRLLFTMGYTTGFRISELLSLTVRDVYWGDRLASSIRVRRRAMKGAKRSREAPIAPLLRPFLTRWRLTLIARDIFHPTVPLFISRTGLRPISRVQAWRILHAAFERAGVYAPRGGLGTHSMRKTYAARMYAHFDDVFKVQQALGHASPASTVAYLSFLDADHRAAVESAFPDTQKEPCNVEQFPNTNHATRS